ncbi:head-tail connector protein [Priestia endophytica]|uniref:head-tail connector protein n=1 Tax=Priestia endophytica TaxID=135735 RepID=UPI00203CA2BF|nr:head-tail connector protein [Priestia endophytica]MCM3536591.1 head-tail connector protein [Priestia endophytica]
MSLLDKVRKELRITHKELDDELQDLINAGFMDLKIAGVNKASEDDPLIIRAIKVYCKANFGLNNEEADRYRDSYNMLKMHLSLAGDYR